MAFCYRFGKSKLKTAFTQFRTFHVHLSHASSFNSLHKPPRLFEIPRPWSFHDRPTSFCNSVRFFAVPVQFQAKLNKDDDYDSGPRLNEEIKSQYVRLVVDDGHSIVSRIEALDRARKLKLDLVEVQRNAKPPVCKIMDYHKETYKKQEVEKERAKSKVTLRKGDCKEVRVSEKTEIKDLKVKAEMVKKLMDKGYRVKCKASGTNENQDMTGPLIRLLALIEDVTVVESGPSNSKKEAFMIVRHVKYGPSKKGAAGGKKSQDVKAQEGNMDPSTANSAESESHSEEVLSDGENHTAQKTFSTLKSNDSMPPDEPENRYKRADPPSANNVRPNTVTENRYNRRPEPRNRFQQTTFTNTDADRRPEQRNRFPQTTFNNTEADRRPDPRNRFQQPTFNNSDAGRSMPSNLNQTRHVPVDTNANPRIENTKQGVTPGPRNPMPSHDISQPRPGYGIFSAQNGPEAQGVNAGKHRNREGHSFSQDSQ
ncbi:putative translation initiation factor 3 [Lupinus albus]|uniref:Putative translation initiation factor 3 n=1 Tax=Lupinus albus TaxID=3870 RepID=A0A6A4QD45_LUPAL|nr:putative translation initiation factor 3 [Lupinus albus]